MKNMRWGATPRCLCCDSLPARAGGPHLREAVAAVHRPVLSGQEGDLGLGPAASAYGVVHLSGVATTVATTAFAAPALTAVRATLGVLVAAAGVELLVVSGKGELGATLCTGEHAVFVSQLDDLLSRLRLRSG